MATSMPQTLNPKPSCHQCPLMRCVNHTGFTPASQGGQLLLHLDAQVTYVGMACPHVWCGRPVVLLCRLLLQEAEGSLTEARGSSSTGTGHADPQHPGQQEPFGIKVGHLGQGFLI